MQSIHREQILTNHLSAQHSKKGLSQVFCGSFKYNMSQQNTGVSGKQVSANCQDAAKKSWNAANDPAEQQKCKDAVNTTATGVRNFVHDEQNKKQVTNAVNQTTSALKKGFGFGKKKK